MESQNLLQRSGVSQTIKQQKVNTSRAILLNLKQKLLNLRKIFKNCAPFSTCTTKINDIFVDEANDIYITMSMYNLIEYSDNYSGTSGSLWQFKRDEVSDNNVDLTINSFQSFKCKEDQKQQIIMMEKAL